MVEGLLRYWPFASSAKEVMFLNEILEVLEVCEITKLEPLINKLFKRLIKCIAGPHLQVINILNDDYKKYCYFFSFIILIVFLNDSFRLLIVRCAISKMTISLLSLKPTVISPFLF